MIADTGTREELRAWWLKSCALPLVGEVYRVSPHGSGYAFPDIWQVRKVLKHRVPPIVLIDIYVVTVTTVSHDKMHKNVPVDFSDWKQKFEEGQLKYDGTNVNESIRKVW
jgi:hypothetical protein